MNRDREREREGRRRWHRIRLTCSRDRLAGAPSHLPRHTRAACVFFFERPIPADKNFLDAKSAFSKCGRRFITGLSPQGGVESSFFPLSLSLSLSFCLSLLLFLVRASFRKSRGADDISVRRHGSHTARRIAVRDVLRTPSSSLRDRRGVPGSRKPITIRWRHGRSPSRRLSRLRLFRREAERTGAPWPHGRKTNPTRFVIRVTRGPSPAPDLPSPQDKTRHSSS